MPKKLPNPLDAEEKEILEALEKGELVSIDNLHTEMETAKQAAKNYAKRNSRINIRISSFDLDRVRKIALEEGLPYQTLISSIIHKFATGRLVDRGNTPKE